MYESFKTKQNNTKKTTKSRISWERLTWTRRNNCHSIIVCIVVDFDWNTYEKFVVHGTNSDRLLCAVKMFALDDVVFHFKYMCKIHKRKVFKFGCIWVHQIQKNIHTNRVLCFGLIVWCVTCDSTWYYY